MCSLGRLLMILSGLLCLFLVLVLIRLLHKLWWTPNRVQKLMALQGIQGPSYRLIHGNTIEISKMTKEAMSRPQNISHDILSHVQPHIHSWTKLYGKNYLQWHGSQAQLVITEPDLCKEILNNGKAYPKRAVFAFKKKLLGDGLFTTNQAEKWSKLRKLATHAFHGESLRSMIPDMIVSAETMLERWQILDGKEIEVFEEFRLYTSEVISRTAFGSSYTEGKNIFEMLMKLTFLLFKNYHTVRAPGISKFFKTSDEIESEKLEKGIRDSIIEIVKKREEKIAGGEDSFGSDFLGVLLKAHHESNENQRISVDDLLDECKAFYFAGQETSNSLLGWTVFLLALHTDWQDKARNEVIELFGREAPNPDGIAKLKTMSMIINESLRLYSPVVSVVRKVQREGRLGNKLIVPGDLELVISAVAIHHDTQIWGEDVHLFKPERFSEGVAKATNNNIGAFLPFSLGPRTCVGLNFATTEAKIALSMILQRYSFTLSPGYVHLPFQYVIVRPKHGVQVMLRSI